MATKNYPKETEAFWQKHIIACRKSGQSRAGYAKCYGLNYNRFLYWLGRSKDVPEQRDDIPIKLLPVKMIAHSTEPVVASIRIDGGYCIEIHDMNALLKLLKNS